MTTKRIIYTRPDGGLSVFTPAPWHRLCVAYTVAERRIVLKAPRHFDSLVREFGTDDLAPEWAETEAEFLARLQARVPAEALDVRIVEADAIPSDRTFRNAWKAGASGVEVDMPHARELHRERLRVQRAPLLAALDVEYMRALEDGKATDDIVARKQALRDATADPAIEAAATPDELKAAIPAALRG